MSTLNEEIARLKTAKANIDRVLIERGVSIPENATLDTYYELINSIKGGVSSSEVTATRADVLAGTYTITADSNGEVVEGTIPIKDGQIYYAEKTNQLIPSGQYLSGNLTIHRLESTNFSAENIKNGVTINVNNGESNVFSVKGTYNGKSFNKVGETSMSDSISYAYVDLNSNKKVYFKILNISMTDDEYVYPYEDQILMFNPDSDLFNPHYLHFSFEDFDSELWGGYIEAHFESSNRCEIFLRFGSIYSGTVTVEYGYFE